MNAQECLKRTAERTAWLKPQRFRPAGVSDRSWPCLALNQQPRLSGMNVCPQTVPSGDGSRQFTTSFASNVCSTLERGRHLSLAERLPPHSQFRMRI